MLIDELHINKAEAKQLLQEYKALLSNTFFNPENVSGSTSKSTWNRLKGIDHKNQDGIGLEACLEKIEEVFSWLDNDIKEKLRRS